MILLYYGWCPNAPKDEFRVQRGTKLQRHGSQDLKKSSTKSLTALCLKSFYVGTESHRWGF